MNTNHNLNRVNPETTTADNEWEHALELDRVEMSGAAAKYDLEQTYTSDERYLLDKGLNVEAQSKMMKHKHLRTGTSLVQGEVSVGEKIQARVQATIRMEVKMVVAFLMRNNPHFMAIRGNEEPNISEFRILERINDHHIVLMARYRVNPPLTPREVVVSTIWQKEGEGEFFVATNSVETEACPKSAAFVRMHFTGIYRLKQNPNNTTHMSVLGSVNLGGVFPKWFNDKITVPQLVLPPIMMMNYFTAVRPPADYDDADSKELGKLVFDKFHPLKGKEEALRRAISITMTRVAVLKAAYVNYSWLDELLFHIIRNKVRPAFAVSTALVSFAREDAKRAGRSFPLALISNVSAESAVDEWVLALPALGEFEREFPFFRPAMNSLAVEVLANSKLGLRLRVYSGAALSIVDGISDTCK
jgi:hypothetical protein